MDEQPPGHDYRAPTPEEHKLDLQNAARELSRRFPGKGFALLVFDFGDDPERQLTYISNAQRPDIIKSMQEWIARQAS
jgi:hypothetical protein